MITSEKIEAWIKDAQQRPEYAPLIVQFIANRLRELAERNEALLSENILLQTGQRIEEYEQRIAYLEYQLDVLKRQLSSDLADAAIPGLSVPPPPEAPSLLIYHARGHLLRLALSGKHSEDVLARGGEFALLEGLPAAGEEAPRLLLTPASEELLFVFTSGRVASRPLSSLPLAAPAPGAWKQATQPDEPHGGESLACLAPISRAALAEYFIQASRRATLKKIRTSMTQSILANHYIGPGVKGPPDRTFDLVLCGKEDCLALVSREGYLSILDVKSLPVTLEDALRLGASDHLVAAFRLEAGRSVLVMTQVGKAIHLAEGDLPPPAAPRSRGEALFSSRRRSEGVRVVGAGAVLETDWGAALDRDGRLSLHPMRQVFASGIVDTSSELVAWGTWRVPFALFSPPASGRET